MKTNNPPAFPTNVDLNNEHTYLGMSLRDYFAIHASSEEVRRNHPECATDTYYEIIAIQRYKYADSMLLAREKSNET